MNPEETMNPTTVAFFCGLILGVPGGVMIAAIGIATRRRERIVVFDPTANVIPLYPEPMEDPDSWGAA